MTTLTEGKHAGGFLVWEVLRDYTRETVTIASERWSCFFDQFYAAQRSGMGFISRGKFHVWFAISINLVWGHQTVG